MQLDSAVRDHWMELQRHHHYPVTAVGIRIDPRDRLTLEVWRREGIAGALQDGAAVDAAFPESLDACWKALIEEFGANGYGHENVLRVVQQRLAKLRSKYPFLDALNAASGIQWTAASFAPPHSLFDAWAVLAQEVVQNAIDNLGRQTAMSKCRSLWIRFYLPNKTLWDRFGAESRLAKIGV